MEAFPGKIVKIRTRTRIKSRVGKEKGFAMEDRGETFKGYTSNLTVSMNRLGFSRHVIHQQILAERVRRGEVGFAAAHFRYFLHELHQAII